MKPIKQVLKSKQGKVWILIVLALILFGNNLGEKKTSAMATCQSYRGTKGTNAYAGQCNYATNYFCINGLLTNCLNDNLARDCLDDPAGCVVARYELSDFSCDDYMCVSCVPTGMSIEEENKDRCCSGYSAPTSKISGYVRCTTSEDPDAEKSTCEGFQKTVSDMMKWIGKDMDCNTRFLAGMGIMFMAGILMISAI